VAANLSRAFRIPVKALVICHGFSSVNVLFVLYNGFNSNSAVHVYHWANELAALGVSCLVAVPEKKESLSALGPARFDAREFAELKAGAAFPDGRGPDIVHAWTPRENVRRLCRQLSAQHSFRQFIHLEDNEQHLLANMSGKSWKTLTALSMQQLDALIPAHLSHPVRAAEFLQSADGVTVIIDRLREFVPAGVPSIELWPSADPKLFSPRPLNRALRSKLGIPPKTTVFVYTGNVHPANAVEVRSLYVAVAILNREGHPAVLLRAGQDGCPFLGPDESWGRKHSIEMGYMPHRQIPDLLTAADILVQPGRPDPFNDYRFPSKLPEFLAIGRPVIVPAANLGLHMKHGVDAFVLPKVDALAIVEAAIEITGDSELYHRLATGARDFFERRLSWEKTAAQLLAFYNASTAKARPA
jgi:glycosyltransferase involved in cell wall biosynthesis